MTGTNDPVATTLSTKQAALAVIEKQLCDVLLDEIVNALWAWSMEVPNGPDACTIAANRVLAINPSELVLASRAARDALILGMSQRIALDVVQALPEEARLDDVLVAVATWHWPDDSVD